MKIENTLLHQTNGWGIISQSLGKCWRRISRWWWRSLLTIALLWVILSVWQAPTIVSSQSKTQELRGVWMTNVGAALMYYTTRLDEVVANIAQHNLNTLYPAVWNRGYTLHPSAIASRAGGWSRDPLTKLPLLPFQNVLSGLIEQAHRQHLRLIPWFEYGLMMPPRSPIAKKHPDWLTTTQSGSKGEGWLNPFHPDVRRFLKDLMVEVVRNYPVDGIQLDDHFGLPIEFGYDPYTVRLYRNDRGTNPPRNPANPEWIKWRADRITQLMENIVRAVKAARPQAIVSLSPNAPDYAYQKFLQDWTRWVKLGLVDEVIVQVYRQDLATFKSELYSGRLRDLRQFVPIGIGLYTGPFLSAKPIGSLSKEIEAVRAAGYRGVSFFCWETTLWLFKGSSEKQVKRALLKLFPTQSKAPIAISSIPPN